MEAPELFGHGSQGADALRRFNNHSMVSLELLTKMEKTFTRKYAHAGYTPDKYTQLFSDAKNCYKVLVLIIEQIESDLGFASLQFLAQPFKKIHLFLTALLNLVLDAFAERLTEHPNTAPDPPLKTEPPRVSSQAEVLLLRKKHFQHRQKFNYLAKCDIDPEQDGNFLRELQKVLQNKEVGQRYKIPTTSIEIENVKDKMQDIIHFADIISEQNARLKMQQLSNIDIFKQNRQAVQDLTARIFANFEKAFKARYVSKIHTTSQYIAERMFIEYKLGLVSQQTQTYNFGSAKKTVQVETLLKDIESKGKLLAQYAKELEQLQLALRDAEIANRALSEEKKKSDELVKHFSGNFQSLELEFSTYKSDTETNQKQMRNLLYKKDQRISEYREMLDKIEKTKQSKIGVPKEVQCEIRLFKDQEMQTQSRPTQEQYTISIMKQKEETLGKLNIIKQTRIQRLQGYNSKLKNHLRNTFQQLQIEIKEQDIDLFLKKIEVIDRTEIRRRISNVAETLAYKNFNLTPISQNKPKQPQLPSSSLESSLSNTPVPEQAHTTSTIKSLTKRTNRLTLKPLILSYTLWFHKRTHSQLSQTDPMTINSTNPRLQTSNKLVNTTPDNSLPTSRKNLKYGKHNGALSVKLLNPLQIDSEVVCESIWNMKYQVSVGCQVNFSLPNKREVFSNLQNRSRPRIVQSNKSPPQLTVPSQFKRRNLHHDARITKIQSFQNLPELPNNDSSRLRIINPLLKQQKQRRKDKSLDMFIIERIKTTPEEHYQEAISYILSKMKFTEDETAKIGRYIRQLQSSMPRRVDVKLEAERIIREYASRHRICLKGCSHFNDVITILNKIV